MHAASKHVLPLDSFWRCSVVGFLSVNHLRVTLAACRLGPRVRWWVVVNEAASSDGRRPVYAYFCFSFCFFRLEARMDKFIRMMWPVTILAGSRAVVAQPYAENSLAQPVAFTHTWLTFVHYLAPQKRQRRQRSWWKDPVVIRTPDGAAAVSLRWTGLSWGAGQSPAELTGSKRRWANTHSAILGRGAALSSAAHTPLTAQDQHRLICVVYDLLNTCIL